MKLIDRDVKWGMNLLRAFEVFDYNYFKRLKDQESAMISRIK